MHRKSIAALCIVAFAILPACSRSPNSLFDKPGYYVRGDKAYYLDAFPGSATEIAAADASTFQPLAGPYAKDRLHAYFRGGPIPGADASTFQALNDRYARDRRQVYTGAEIMPGADAASFQVLQRGNLGRDRNHVYLLGRAISDDPAHFVLIDPDMSKDGHAVYSADGQVLSDDPAHFVVVSNTNAYLYTKDSHTVAVNHAPIAGANPTGFQVIREPYARDDRHIFYFTDEIAGADMASFQVLDGPYAKDVRRAYWKAQPIAGADPATFRVLNANFECAADAEHAYYELTAIGGADPRTFPPGRNVTNCSQTSITFSQ
jgi:DKNYY family protein